MLNKKGLRLRIDGLLYAQQGILETLQLRHVLWSNEIDNPGIERLHSEINNLIRQSIEKYKSLHGMYSSKSESLTPKY